MKKVGATILLFVLCAFKGEEGNTPVPHKPCIARLDGKAYYYNIDKKKPSLTFSFLFYCEGDSLRGVMLGPAIQNGANTLFFRAYVNNLIVANDSVSFNFIQGQLYRNPYTLSDYNNYGGQYSVAFAQERLFYKGIMKGDSIIDLKCQNKYFACSVDSIVLRKK